MNHFRTTFDIPKEDIDIRYGQPIFSIGSCFAVHMADRLRHHCFDIRSNPNGIIFNPVSLAINLRNIINKKAYDKTELIHHNDLWHSWQHHHTHSHIDADLMTHQINEIASTASDHLAKSKILLVTFGTAFAYRYIETGEIVANCHKIPNHRFEKIRLSEHQIVGQWQDTIDILLDRDPQLQIIMTVSPVRHLKNGVVANQRSKAALHLSIEALARQYPQVNYFPAYELMMDDLRDYRFYKSDMLHPSDEAVTYIWDQFVQTYMDDQTITIMKEVDQLQKAKAHRPMHPDSKEAKAFAADTDVKWARMMVKYELIVRPF